MPIKLQTHQHLLLDALLHPSRVTEFSNSEWELLLCSARRGSLLGFLAVLLARHDLLQAIPARAANQLQSGLLEARKRQQLVRWELNRIHWALRESRIPHVALKGLAYGLAGLPSAEGRIFVDLDVLVRKNHLDKAEATLLQKGWQSREISAYDEYYYRAWSHEIPALVHRERHTEIDLHHAIVPVTSKLKVDSNLLFADAIIGNDGVTRILGPIDMVLHCAVNLFQNNDLADDLRDLLDLDDALRCFSEAIPEFWQALVMRANQLGLGKPLFYGLHYARLILQTPVPSGLEEQLGQRPGFIARRIMDLLVPAALFPLHPDKPALYARLARLGLYLRSHWLRMPVHLLLIHFAHKSYALVGGNQNARTAL